MSYQITVTSTYKFAFHLADPPIESVILLDSWPPGIPKMWIKDYAKGSAHDKANFCLLRKFALHCT